MRKKRLILIILFAAVLIQIYFSGMVTHKAMNYIKRTALQRMSFVESLRPEIEEDRTEVSFSGDRHFYVFSVVAINSSRVPTWDRFVVNGWEKSNAENYTYICCYLFRNGELSSTKQSEKRRYIYATPPIHAAQVVCGVNNKLMRSYPVAVALVLYNESCNRSAKFHKPFYTMKLKFNEFAIHAKVVYGEKNPSDLIEWLEYQRFFKVAKVLVYPYMLAKESKEVLEYYERIGFVETIPFDCVPLHYEYPRMFGVPNITMIHDEQVINYDAQERLSAYKYFTIIDTDEYILPMDPNITSFSELMDQLLTKYDQASSFTMYTYLHLTTWGKTDPASELFMTSYGNHTEALINTPKLLHVTDRLLPGSARIHAAKGHKGYIGYRANASDVVLKHYRACRDIWLRPSRQYNLSNQCMAGFMRIKDIYMDRIASAILPRILEVRRQLDIDLLPKNIDV